MLFKFIKKCPAQSSGQGFRAYLSSPAVLSLGGGGAADFSMANSCTGSLAPSICTVPNSTCEPIVRARTADLRIIISQYMPRGHVSRAPTYRCYCRSSWPFVRLEKGPGARRMVEHLAPGVDLMRTVGPNRT